MTFVHIGFIDNPFQLMMVIVLAQVVWWVILEMMDQNIGECRGLDYA